MSGLTRREMLKRVVVAGAAVSLPGGHRGPAPGAALAAGRQAHTYQVLDAGEGAILEAVVARLIPADDRGPGAREAGAARYIDRALGTALRGSRGAYRDGLAALDRYARASHGAPFTALDAATQDDVLADLEADRATGFTPSASAFFELVLDHTQEGTFSDPAYGGNADFIGWELIGYPGVRTMVTPDLQRLDRMPPARQVSAYDFPAFSAARARRTNGG